VELEYCWGFLVARIFESFFNSLLPQETKELYIYVESNNAAVDDDWSESERELLL